MEPKKKRKNKFFVLNTMHMSIQLFSLSFPIPMKWNEILLILLLFVLGEASLMLFSRKTLNAKKKNNKKLNTDLFFFHLLKKLERMKLSCDRPDYIYFAIWLDFIIFFFYLFIYLFRLILSNSLFIVYWKHFERKQHKSRSRHFVY